MEFKDNPEFVKLRAAVTGGAAGDPAMEYLTLRDGMKVFLRNWRPAGAPRCAVVCLHGAGGHGEYFSMIADILLPDGAAVFVADYRGHGMSGGRRGDYPSFQCLLEDSREVVEEARRRLPGIPVFILGESMGGAVAVNFAAQFPRLISGMVLFAPALLFRKSVPWPQILLLPYYLLSALISPGRPVINTKGREEEGIKNPLHVAYDKSCPLHLKDISPRYFLQLTKYMETGLKECPAKIAAPVLLFQGEADAGIDPAGARLFMERLASRDRELVMYPKGFHALLTDPDAPDIASRLAAWVASHTE